MPAFAFLPPQTVRLQCEAAARALRCAATVVPDSAFAAVAEARGALCVPLAGGTGEALCLERPGGPPWSDDDRAVAAAFADALAAALATGYRLAELQRHVDEIQSIASLGSYQWFVAEDRLEWSAEQLRIHGRDASTHPRGLADFVACVHPDDRARQHADLERLMAEGFAESRYRVVRPDGDVRWVDARGSVVRDESGTPVRVVGTVLDVTRLATAERELRAANEDLERRVADRTAELRESSAHFRRLIEHAHDLIVIVDEEGVARYGSPSVRRVLGFEPEGLEGRSIIPLVHPDDADYLLGWLRGLAAAPGVTHRAEYRFRHGEGHYVYLEAVSRPAADYRPGDGHVINVRDVTERTRAEEALRASEARHRSLIEQLPAIIYTASVEEGNPTLFASPQSERLLGFSEAEWCANPRLWLERIHPADRDRVAAEWSAAHAAGRRFSAEYRLIARDGRVLWFRDEAILQRDADGRPQYIQGVMLDVTDRREAEEELERNNERWRAMLDNAHDIVTILDPEGRMGYQSPALTRVLGYTPEELEGQSAFAYMHPDDVGAVIEQLGRVLAAPGSVGHAEYRFRHKDGTWRYVEAFGRTLSPHTAEKGVVANVRDITDRKQTELALQRSEEHFRRLIENGSDLLMICGEDLTLSYVSPSAERLLGYTPDEMLAKVPSDMVHPDDIAFVVDATHDIIARPGVVRRAAWRIRHKDGSWRRLDAIGRTIDPRSAAAGVVINARDVTEQRAAEEALQRSEEHFRRLIENASDLLMISAPDGALTYVSPSATRLIGYAPADLLGIRPEQLVHPDDLDAVNDVVRRLIERPGTVLEVAFRIRHRDGGWRVMETIGRTIAPDSGSEGIVINGRDVTERRASEEALRQATADAEQAREEAERANHAKSEFLSRMSHELRTPLNSILGFAQVLEDLDLPPEYRGGVRHILNGGRHLLNLINEVLDIARIEADRQPMSLEPVRVRAVVREAIDMVRPLAIGRGVQVVEAVHLVSDAYVRADRQRLVQVMLNLLSNAVKYNRPGGEVRVTGCALPGDDGGERVRLSVRDEGVGIAPGQQDQLFVPFARLGAERSGVEGTGLGLALSQRLAQAMGGKLFLERSDADGSVFSVDLVATANPLDEAPALLARAEDADAGAHGAATLLYVEDNLANLSLVETILLPRPEWRVIPALQGRLGIELAVEHAPDVVLLDLHLPDMHGAQVLRALRAHPRTAGIPVVVISADATPRSIEALTAEGADAFLTKPLDVRVFLQTVERLATRARGAAGR